MQFNDPRDIAIHPHSNEIYVTDRVNNRVQILDDDLTFSGWFGSYGSENGNFNGPYGIAFDNSGRVYVADRHNHRVNVFTPKGEYIQHFGQKGDDKECLNQPCDVVIDSNNIVYVTEGGNSRISMFTRDGGFLGCFGTMGKGLGEFIDPTYVFVKEGKIYVADCGNDHVQVF